MKITQEGNDVRLQLIQRTTNKRIFKKIFDFTIHKKYFEELKADMMMAFQNFDLKE